MVQITLVDLNPEVVKAWKEAFKNELDGDVSVLCGSILSVSADVWVTPTNSLGHMSGGTDAAIRNHLGAYIENCLQTDIKAKYNGFMPVGHAVLVPTQTDYPQYVVATPTMEGESDDLRRTKNTALACAAAFQAIYAAIEDAEVTITHVALPGLGAGTGKVDPATCAALMKIGYTLFLRKRYETFEEMLEALNKELVDSGRPQVAAAPAPAESMDFPEGFPPEVTVAGKPKKGKKTKIKVTEEEPAVPDFKIGTAL